MRAAINLPTTGTIPEPCSTISATRTSSTPSATPSFRPTGSATSGEIRLALVAGTAGRNCHGSAHLKRAWKCLRQTRPPGRGDFWILKIAHAPSPKNLSKNGSAHKGGSLCVKDVFAKKFLVPGEDSAVDASARSSDQFRSAASEINTVPWAPA